MSLRRPRQPGVYDAPQAVQVYLLVYSVWWLFMLLAFAPLIVRGGDRAGLLAVGDDAVWTCIYCIAAVAGIVGLAWPSKAARVLSLTTQSIVAGMTGISMLLGPKMVTGTGIYLPAMFLSYWALAKLVGAQTRGDSLAKGGAVIRANIAVSPLHSVDKCSG